VRTQFEGFHCYPEAPTAVAFLRFSHRHLFKVSATFTVAHDNRDLEFFTIKRVLDDLCATIQQEMRNLVPPWSCENIAENLFYKLVGDYPTVRSVTVSEDGENDGTYEVIPTHE
jgi:hypothetical protein